MKRIFFIVCLFLLIGALSAQDTLTIKEGVYKNLKEFKKQTPSYPADLFEISFVYGKANNQYKVKRTDKIITNETINEEIWGIYKDDTLYLNGNFLTGEKGYAKVELFGKYCFVKTKFPTNGYIQKELGISNSADMSIGMTLGGVVGGALVSANTNRISLTYNLENGKRTALSKDNMLLLLKHYPELKAEYETERLPHNESTFRRYLDKLNALEKVSYLE